jgi:hypothetical protein
MKMRNMYTFFLRKPEWKRPLGRHRRRWEEDNIKEHLREIRYGVRTEFMWFRIETGGWLLCTS